MIELTPSIAEDIQMLTNYWLEPRCHTGTIARMTLERAAERVEAYLSSLKPDHL